MANTSFIDYQTVINAAWCNDVNNVAYNVLGSGATVPTTGAQVLTNIGGLSNAAGAVGTANIANGAVTNTQMAAGAAAANLGSSSVTTAMLQNGAATLNKLDTTGSAGQYLTATGPGTAPVWATGPSPTSAARNVVLTGPVTSGVPSAIGVGSNLTPAFQANLSPIAIAFANGFGTAGQLDNISYVSSAANWGAVSANNTSYLYAGYSTGTTVSLGSSLAPPQVGAAYQQGNQSLLHFDGTVGAASFLDDFGSTWVVGGGAPKLQGTAVKFGSTALGGQGTSSALNGTSDYIKNTSPNFNGQQSWSIRAWVYFTALTTTAVASATNTAGYGIHFGITSAGKGLISLSSTGNTWNIASALSGGTATLTTGAWNFLEVTYDAVASKYFYYINGVVDQTVSSANTVCSISELNVGSGNSAGTRTYMSGYLDEYEFLPYCSHPNGTTYSNPTGASAITTAGYPSDWYSVYESKMYSVSAPSASAGANPTFTQVLRVYVGTVTAGASAISSVFTYGYSGSGGTAQSVGAGLGLGQGYSNLTAQRALTTTYYNTTNKPIYLAVMMNVISGDTTILVNGSVVVRNNSSAASPSSSISAVIPPGASYSVTVSSSNTINSWWELR